MSQIQKIKILHFVHSLNEGGIERLLLEMCRKIDKDKFEIQICCLYEKGVIAPEFEAESVKIHFVNAKRDFNPQNIYHNIIAIKRIVKIIKDEKINITHGHEFYSTIFSRISALISEVRKRYITLHNVYYWWTPGVHKFQKLLSHITTKIICNSKATLKYSLAHDKIDKTKYRLIYNGIDCDKFAPDNKYSGCLQNEYSIQPGRIVCMTVGSISHRKGYEYLLKAFSSLSKVHNELILIMAGDKHFNEEDYYDKLIKSISDLNLKDKVIITGNRNDINEILNSCDIFIMPSVAEGFGLALAEAMATEKICIASDIEPFKEIIEDGINGFLFKSQDPDSLEKIIKRVLTANDDQLRIIRTNARERIVIKFGIDTMIKGYEKLYSE